jgi:hypothetical protein
MLAGPPGWPDEESWLVKQYKPEPQIYGPDHSKRIDRDEADLCIQRQSAKSAHGDLKSGSIGHREGPSL